MTVNASNATSSVSLHKSTTSTGYTDVGDVIDYGYTVTNTGTTTLSGIAVNDNLVPDVVCPDSSLAPGASESCSGSYSVTQADVDAGSVTNIATASALNPQDAQITSGQASTTVNATGTTTSISLQKSTDSAGYGAAGDVINYSYTVTNTGNTTVHGISVADNLVASVTCPSGSVAPGATETCSGSYSVTQADVDAGSVTNTATASATGPHSNAVSSNSSSVTVEASGASSSLDLTKSTTSTGYAAAGDVIHYNYSLTNTGTTTLSDVGVSDNLIADVSCPDSSLAPGASETCTGSYTVTQSDVDAGSVTNTAAATATDPQNNTVTSGSSSITVDASGATSSLAISKSTNSNGYGAAGDVIDYSYTVTNTGTTTLTGVAVADNKVANVSCPEPDLGGRGVRDLHRQLYGDSGRRGRRIRDQHGKRDRHQSPEPDGLLGYVLGDGRRFERHVLPGAGQVDQLDRVRQGRGHDRLQLRGHQHRYDHSHGCRGFGQQGGQRQLSRIPPWRQGRLRPVPAATR